MLKRHLPTLSRYITENGLEKKNKGFQAKEKGLKWSFRATHLLINPIVAVFQESYLPKKSVDCYDFFICRDSRL